MGCGCEKAVLGAIHERALQRRAGPAQRMMLDEARREAAKVWEAMHAVPAAQRRAVFRRAMNAIRPGAADRVEKVVAILNARGTHVPTAMREAIAREMAATVMGRLTPQRLLTDIAKSRRASAAATAQRRRPAASRCTRCGGSGRRERRHPGDPRLLISVRCESRLQRGDGLGLFGPSGVTWPIPVDPNGAYNEGFDGPQWSTARQAYQRVKKRVAAFTVKGYPKWGDGLPKWNQGLPYSGEALPPGMGLWDPRNAGVTWPEPPEDRPYVTGIVPWSRSLALAPRRPGIGGLGDITAADITSWSCDAAGNVFARIQGGRKVPAESIPASALDAELRKGLAVVRARCADPKRMAAAQQKTQERALVAGQANAKADAQYAARMEKYSAANLLKAGLRETTADIVGGATGVVTSVGGGILKGLAPLLIPLLGIGLGVVYLMRRASAPVVKVGG